MSAAATHRRAAWLDLAFLLGAVLLLVGPGIGLRDPWPADEPRFVLVARDMLASHNWFVPMRAGQLYPDKPPLFPWMEAVVLALTGSIRLAFQIPSLLAALVTVTATWDLGRRLWNRRVALWAGGVLVVSLQFVLQARSGQIDGTVAAFVAIGLYGILRHALKGPAFGWYLVGWLAMGLGIITKGVGFLPLLAFFPLAWAWWRGWRGVGARPSLRWWLGLPLLLLPVVAWLGPLLARAHAGDARIAAYLDEILFRQTATRYADPWGHHQPFWYYFSDVLPWAWLPGILALPWLVPAWRRRLARRDARYLVLLGWVVLVLLFFTLSPGKRGVYVLPALPAFALAVAPLAPGLWRKRGPQRTAFGVALFLSCVVGSASLVALIRPSAVLPGGETELSAVAWPLLLAAIAGLTLAVVSRPRRGFAALSGLLAVLWWVYGLWIYPAMNPYRSGEALMAALERTVEPDDEVVMLDWREQHMLKTRIPIHHFGYRAPRERALAQAATWVANAPDRYVLLPKGRAEPCFAADDRTPIYEDYDTVWVLLDASAVTGACEPATGEMFDYVPPTARPGGISRRGGEDDASLPRMFGSATAAGRISRRAAETAEGRLCREVASRSGDIG